MREKVGKKLEEYEIDVQFEVFREGLLAAARRAGDPNTITRPELSAYLVNALLEPSILYPIRHVVRSQETAAVLILLLVLVVPVLFFRIAAAIRSRPAP